MSVTPFKERIECALPARMMYHIASSDVFYIIEGRESEAHALLMQLRDHLETACLEPLQGLAPKVQKIVGWQIDRLHAQVMDGYHDHRADKVAAAIYYFLKELTDTGYLELWEGSPVAEAAAIYVTTIEHVFEEGRLDDSAQKQARKIVKKLQERGYYR